jgi:SAM-dependent methyltransferase
VLGGSLWSAEADAAAHFFGDLVIDGGEAAKRRLRPRRESLVEIVDLYRRGAVGPDREFAGEVRMHEPMWRFEESASRLGASIASWLRYRMWGVYYKAPLFAAVLRELLPDGQNLDVVDHGGDVGLIPLQLLLEDRPEVRSALNVEVSSAVVLGGKRLHDHFGSRLAGRYLYAISASEEFEYDREYDAVSFTHCLLYMRRDRLESTLRRAYENLRPGGVLMLLENTSPPTGAGRDSAIIFSPDELDELVTRIGPVDYFRVRDGQRCRGEESAEAPTLRVVVKD